MYGNGKGQVQGMGLGLMNPNVWCRNVHIGPTHGKKPGPIVSYCAGPLPVSVPLTFMFSVN